MQVDLYEMNLNLPTNDRKLPSVEKNGFGEITSDDPACISNLQLFSLKQAYRYFEELEKNGSNFTDFRKKDYIVFIIVCAGTSISQLLGQNTTHKQKKTDSTRVDGPQYLFKRIFGEEDELENDFNEVH
jgi:hypothetical protein